LPGNDQSFEINAPVVIWYTVSYENTNAYIQLAAS